MKNEIRKIMLSGEGDPVEKIAEWHKEKLQEKAAKYTFFSMIFILLSTIGIYFLISK